MCKVYRPDTCRWTICLDPDNAEVASKLPNLELLQLAANEAKAAGKAAAKGGGKAAAKSDAATGQAENADAASVCEGLDKLIAQLELSPCFYGGHNQGFWRRVLFLVM